MMNVTEISRVKEIMNMNLITGMLTSSERLSLGLGLLSVVLGTIAIVQAFFYKREQERQARVQDVFLREQRINMAFSCIRNREMYRIIRNKESSAMQKSEKSC